jgi:hypothetical protein
MGAAGWMTDTSPTHSSLFKMKSTSPQVEGWVALRTSLRWSAARLRKDSLVDVIPAWRIVLHTPATMLSWRIIRRPLNVAHVWACSQSAADRAVPQKQVTEGARAQQNCMHCRTVKLSRRRRAMRRLASDSVRVWYLPCQWVDETVTGSFARQAVTRRIEKEGRIMYTANYNGDRSAVRPIGMRPISS